MSRLDEAKFLKSTDTIWAFMHNDCGEHCIDETAKDWIKTSHRSTGYDQSHWPRVRRKLKKDQKGHPHPTHGWSLKTNKETNCCNKPAYNLLLCRVPFKDLLFRWHVDWKAEFKLKTQKIMARCETPDKLSDFVFLICARNRCEMAGSRMTKVLVEPFENVTALISSNSLIGCAKLITPTCSSSSL